MINQSINQFSFPVVRTHQRTQLTIAGETAYSSTLRTANSSLPKALCDIQAHTCENILELPNYQESLLAVHGDADSLLADEMKEKLKSIIDDRLRLAITCCNSYGLDDRHAL